MNEIINKEGNITVINAKEMVYKTWTNYSQSINSSELFLSR